MYTIVMALSNRKDILKLTDKSPCVSCSSDCSASLKQKFAVQCVLLCFHGGEAAAGSEVVEKTCWVVDFLEAERGGEGESKLSPILSLPHIGLASYEDFR